MRRQTSKTFLLIVVLVGMPFLRAIACSCAGTPSVKDNWKTADQVFLAEAVAADTSGRWFGSNGQMVMTYNLRILESFKSALQTKYPYRTFTSSSSCDLSFWPGRKYLVYAYGHGSGAFLTASLCSRTDFLEQVDPEELRLLRKLHQDHRLEGNIPPSVSDPEQKSNGTGFPKSSHGLDSAFGGVWGILVSVLGTSLAWILLFFFRPWKTKK